MPGVVGAAVLFRVTARERQVEQVRSREREQLARERHDTVAHHVSAVVIIAQAGRVLAGTDPSATVEALEGVEEEGARTLEEMRAMVAALRDRGVGAELAPPAGVADLERLVRTPGGRLRGDLGLDGELDALPPAVDAAGLVVVVDYAGPGELAHLLGRVDEEHVVVLHQQVLSVGVALAVESLGAGHAEELHTDAAGGEQLRAAGHGVTGEPRPGVQTFGPLPGEFQQSDAQFVRQIGADGESAASGAVRIEEDRPFHGIMPAGDALALGPVDEHVLSTRPRDLTTSPARTGCRSRRVRRTRKRK
ncbi:sensor histidine kinase [Streptomyces sp. NBC_01092]|uniref:sensor histidine kinase n=1 Tax=Streptomyces sp. NBC_01092 TaxID=2903748 RepID=UPI003864E8D3|nr:histidine kinase dimerization/phosphoacceptor domain-containing protein [Streptomyces sp. NBC_01092]